MKLITETVMDMRHLVEANGDKKSHYIQGKFLSTKPNCNRRIYSEAVLAPEVARFQTAIKEKRSLGELGHPENPSLNLDKVSHLITELKFDGADVIGKAKILDTPMGKIAQNFLEEGVGLGVSSRGMGSVIRKGDINEVQNDYRLSTIDIVHEPSGIDCWVNGIMENAEWIYEASSDSWHIAEQIKQSLKNKNMKQIAENQAKFFQMFLNNLK